MKWSALWITLFGRTELWGLNMGFWVAMTAVLVIVVLMNVIFWCMKPVDSKHWLNLFMFQLPIAITLSHHKKGTPKAIFLLWGYPFMIT